MVVDDGDAVPLLLLGPTLPTDDGDAPMLVAAPVNRALLLLLGLTLLTDVGRVGTVTFEPCPLVEFEPEPEPEVPLVLADPEVPEVSRSAAPTAPEAAPVLELEPEPELEPVPVLEPEAEPVLPPATPPAAAAVLVGLAMADEEVVLDLEQLRSNRG